MTDEDALYSEDGATLIECKTRQETFTVRDGCRMIGHKAFMYLKNLKQVVLPDTLEALDSFAFSCTSLGSFTAPPHLSHIGEKAFFQCPMLRDVNLNEGLLSIGDEAFARTCVHSIEIPSTTMYVGRGAFMGSPLEHKACQRTFDIAEDNETLVIDDEGGLYRRVDDGLVLIEMMSDNTKSHRVLDGTVAIASKAYARARSIEHIDLPEGLRTIGKGAMRHCVSLKSVHIPETLERIDDEAFFQSSIEEIYLPANFRFLGSRALATGTDNVATLRNIDVDPDCSRFYMTSGLLCERTSNGRSFVVLYSGPESKVVVPDEATSIGPYAFMRTSDIEELHVHANIMSVHPLAFSQRCRIGLLHLELKEPACGREYIDVEFPGSLQNSGWGFRSNTFSEGLVNPELLCEHYDRSVLRMYDAYERGRRIIERLLVPQFLEDSYRDAFLNTLSRTVEETCREFARHGYTQGFGVLADFGVLNDTNISEMVDAVGEVGDAAMTGYLLELKRSRFGDLRTDFKL